MRTKLIIIAISLISLSSCKHDVVTALQEIIDTTGTDGNGGGTGGGGTGGGGTINPCDPNTIYFQNDVLPIIISNCAQSGCHDAASAKDGIVLDNYDNIMRTGGIIKGNAWSSEIYEVLVETDPEDVMPPAPKSKLAAEQIALIAGWINAGAINNSCNETNCDTTNVKYSTHVDVIIANNCRGCHSGTAPSGNISLVNFTQVKASVDNGSLLGTIKHQTGFVAMPYRANKMNDCDIRKIELWVNSGAQNN